MRLSKLILASALLFCLTTMQAQKYVGGDLSVLLKYEEQSATYLDKDGKAIADVLTFVKEQGWNTIRVRLFDDPSKDTDKNVCQDIEYVKRLGKRIKDAGLYFLLDIHYSDTWADPEHQVFPYSWSIWSWYPDESVYKYTKEWLGSLVSAGATPDFIQTGNEISFGMLWGFNLNGKYEDWDEYGGHLEATADWKDYTNKHWDNFTNMLKAAGRACREECPNAKIIIHTEQCANNPTLDVAFFNRIKQYGIDYDIIGISYYPYFKGPLANLDNGLTELEAHFPDKMIQLVETGYPSKWEVPGTSYNYTSTYPYSHEGQRKYTADLITMLNKHAKVNGLSWWYAEANAKGCTGSLKEGWYNASLFDNETGRALPALYELKNFSSGSSGISHITADKGANDTWYSLDGKNNPSKPTTKGLYINNGQKIIVR
ncbi:arabinogalactan endo-1,4-beta-galactosidase [Prevotella sp. ne3005]|uniref:glycosyl hydrolase 53 family protein n=1 Tax=Prevotella sp. ne3005 TaxID=1761887 RepID=UPI0008C4EADF|nr:glycosyl hydrolase 53 family protein [Prevotella sp. ne3005]SEN37162.1 arabinogalactan endo-1,4-beta-galactosidase [Prevotella sp. ne3005]